MAEQYNSNFTGPEIDAILGGGVRYDKAQSLTYAQQTQARQNIGAAVSGGGVMERTIEIRPASADETYDTFCQRTDAVLATMPNRSVKFVLAYPPGWWGDGTDMAVLYKLDDNYASLRSIGSYNLTKPSGFMMIKSKHDSSDTTSQWDPLEYIDPPMALGVEYRTTERCQGKPVYTKLISCGDFVADKSILWYDNLSEIAFIKDINVSNYRMTFPDSYASGRTIVLRGSDSWGGTVFACIKYTKTAD